MLVFIKFKSMIHCILKTLSQTKRIHHTQSLCKSIFDISNTNKDNGKDKRFKGNYANDISVSE